ncbi:MAG: Mitochondrial beta-keto-acyl synthase [Candelina mexicana]|nr:MAG: Mitochondrial beta-keto-acyl synthase [Candelina mexicana]
MRRVVVTGLGAVTPLGVGVTPSWSRLLKGHCGIVSVRGRGSRFAELPCQIAAVVPSEWHRHEGRKAEELLSRDASHDRGFGSRDKVVSQRARKQALFIQYAMAAASQAMEDAAWCIDSEEKQQATGVCLGSGIGNLEDVYTTSVLFEKEGYHKVSPLFVPRLLINLAAGHLSMKFHLKGPNHAVTTACTTGAHAIGDASRFIAFGDADVMLAGGAESCIHPLAVAGFARAKSLAVGYNETPHLASRPFDQARSGFVMGEGAGVLLLEELEHAKARQVPIYAEVKGYGLSGDAHHMTAPAESGEGAFLAMKRALQKAGIPPSAVDYVNAHATSTTLGDTAENRAIKRLLLGENGKGKASDINVSSNKGSIGHLLGAAGAVEAIFTILAMQQGILPPTLNLENPGDPGASGEDYNCNYVPNIAQEKRVDVALSNSFGFGGTNASLCFTKYQ